MIDMTKKYQTRDGRAVRILCVDGPHPTYPVIGIIDGTETGTDVWTELGLFASAGHRITGLDLIPVPTKHESWCVINRGGPMARLATLYSSEDTANECRGDFGFVAHVTWES